MRFVGAEEDSAGLVVDLVSARVSDEAFRYSNSIDSTPFLYPSSLHTSHLQLRAQDRYKPTGPPIIKSTKHKQSGNQISGFGELPGFLSF